ncbi:MAG: hypothetical protein KC505_08595 [Myxococcales bacterium]|nr:hypothetical protein [Myxococcales bacterium]USN50593.1 MAG: hypothetical protein H6731_10075 [Myxococcales bacterium]
MTFYETIEEINQAFAKLSRDEKIKLLKANSARKNAVAILSPLYGTKKAFDFFEYFTPNLNIEDFQLLGESDDWETLPALPIKKIIESEKFPRQCAEISLDPEINYLLRQRNFNKEVDERIKTMNNGNVYKVACGAICLAMADWTLNEQNTDWQEKVLSYPFFGLGILPHNLVNHFNKMSHETNITIKHLKINNFANFIDITKNELNKNNPITILLPISAIKQHYVNIVAINDREQEIIILDPAGFLSVVDYDWLKEIMCTDISCSSGYAYGACSVFTWPLFKMFISFGPYNAFVYRSQKEKLD